MKRDDFTLRLDLGHSVAPAQAEALVLANFAHETQSYGRAAA